MIYIGILELVNIKINGIIIIILLLLDILYIYFSLLFTGVFFDNRVEHVKFVDFCGKYRIPLLQYLCSSRCISESSSESSEDEAVAGSLMRKVLLG